MVRSARTCTGRDPYTRVRHANRRIRSSTRLAGPDTALVLTHPNASTRILPAHDDCNAESTPIEFP